jgi:hypothetical protein
LDNTIKIFLLVTKAIWSGKWIFSKETTWERCRLVRMFQSNADRVSLSFDQPARSHPPKQNASAP